MRKRFRFIPIFFLLVLLTSCGFVPFLAKLTSGSGTEFKFNMDGAKAIAAGASTTTTRALSGSARATTTTSPLVKVMEDGVSVPLVDMGNVGYTPNVAFITTGSVETGDEGCAYVCFDQYMYTVDGRVQFLRINPDNSYNIIWPVNPTTAEQNTDGTVATWSWWGMDSDPLAKGPDGRLYFKVTTWGGNSSSDQIYAYDPRNPTAAAVLITPANSNLSIGTFLVDSQAHLFIQSMNSGSGNSSFLRMYSKDVTAPANIFYTSDSNSTWVRGYKTEPLGNYLILNGYNIRGMNGIIKANIVDAATFDYELLYPNANASNACWIWLVKGFGDTWTSPTVVMRQTTQYYPYTYEWLAEVKDSEGKFSSSKFIARVKNFFAPGSTLDLSNPPSWFDPTKLNEPIGVSSIGEGDDATNVDSNTTLGSLFQNQPEAVLKALFPSPNELFKDWLAKPENADIASINFDMIGAMTWASDGLYGLYSSGWWGGGSANSAKVVKLTDLSGNRALKLINLGHSENYPSQIKIKGDYIYYRYAILDADNQETGKHKLARLNVTTGVDEDLLSASVPEIEITNYDVADDNTILYFVGFDNSTNAILGGKVDLAAGEYKPMESSIKLSKIRVIQ